MYSAIFTTLLVGIGAYTIAGIIYSYVVYEQLIRRKPVVYYHTTLGLDAGYVILTAVRYRYKVSFVKSCGGYWCEFLLRK